MDCGGTYFISVQQVIEKTSIKHAKLLLRQGVYLETIEGHKCDACSWKLTLKECDIFEDLSDPVKIVDLENSLDESCKLVLVYIAGYIQRHYIYNDDNEGGCYNKYGSYLDNINRGGLVKPVDIMVQWVFICYFLFLNLHQMSLCRKSLSKYFIEISDTYGFGIENNHARILSNVLLNNFSKLSTPRSNKETGQKTLKFSQMYNWYY